MAKLKVVSPIIQSGIISGKKYLRKELPYFVASVLSLLYQYYSTMSITNITALWVLPILQHYEILL